MRQQIEWPKLKTEREEPLECIHFGDSRQTTAMNCNDRSNRHIKK